MDSQIKCPKCKSTQISSNQKGWTLTTGFIGSGKVIITCLKCGKRFKPGEDYDAIQTKKKQQEEAMQNPVGWIVMAIILILIIVLYNAC